MNHPIALAVFLLSAGLILYSYALYPVLLLLLPKRRERPTAPVTPTVSVLVSG